MRTLRALWFAAPALVTLSWVGCSPGLSTKLESSPAEIQGVWQSDDPRYEGRNLEIHEDAVVFYVGDGDFTAHAIHEIEVSECEAGRAFDVEYRDDIGELTTFSFVYRPDRDVIVFKNQPHMHWSRVEPTL
jgi:hypothetical protein